MGQTDYQESGWDGLFTEEGRGMKTIPDEVVDTTVATSSCASRKQRGASAITLTPDGVTGGRDLKPRRYERLCPFGGLGLFVCTLCIKSGKDYRRIFCPLGLL